MGSSLNVLNSCRTPYVASSDGFYPEGDNGPAAEPQCDFITREGAEHGLSNSSGSPRPLPQQHGALHGLDILVAVSHVLEPAQQARQQLQHSPLRPPQSLHQETAQSQALQPSDTYLLTPGLSTQGAMDGRRGANTAHIRNSAADTFLGVVNGAPSQYPTLGEAPSISAPSPSHSEFVPSKTWCLHTVLVPHDCPSTQQSVTVTQNPNAAATSGMATVTATATALALVAICVHQLSPSTLPFSLGLHVAVKQLQQYRYSAIAVMAVAAVLVWVVEAARRCSKSWAICWASALLPGTVRSTRGGSAPMKLLLPHAAAALPGSDLCNLQQQQQQGQQCEQQIAGMDAEMLNQTQQQQELRRSEGNAQLLQPLFNQERATTEEAAACTGSNASTAVAVAYGTQGGGLLEAIHHDKKPEIFSSPFMTSAALPSQPSPENSCLRQSCGSSAASCSSAAHLSGGVFTGRGSTWTQCTWLWSLPRRLSSCVRSRLPSLHSWAVGAGLGHDGGSDGDAENVAQEATPSSESRGSFLAVNGDECGGGSECGVELSRSLLGPTVATKIRCAEKSPSGGTTASAAVALPDARAAASVARHGFKGAGSLVTNTRSVYIARLWQAALPGLHLLSRPQRQSSLPIHTDSIASDSQFLPRIGGGGGGGSVAATFGNGHASGPAAASMVWGSVQNSNGQASCQPGASQGIAGLASRLAATASAASCSALSMFGSSDRRRISPFQASGGNSAGGMHSKASRIINGQVQGLRSSNSVMNLISDLLPRVTGGWVHSSSASSGSLSTLVEAPIGGGSGGHSGNRGSRGSDGGGLSMGMAVTGVCNGDSGPAAAAGGGIGQCDPPISGGTHAFLLSSAEFASRKPAFSDLPQNTGRVQVLSVDDEPVNQQVMRALLWAAEYEVLEARSGEDALEIIRTGEVLPDLVLLDVTLGGAVSGFEVCLEIRREYSPGELPVIMITCSSLEEDVIRGLAVGANDYLIKPLRNLELMARIKTQLALKRSIRVAAEARVNRSLLGSILPANVIRQLKQGVTLIAQFHQEVTILFSDIRGFTNLATEWPTEQIILMLNNMFTAFDRLCDQMGVYKVETIGDAYMIVSGHDGVEDHAARMLRMATQMLVAVAEMRGYDGRPLQIRVGVHTGPAHSGVVGLSRPRYCFFGDTVNTASRMESTGFPMAIQVSESTLRAAMACPQRASEFQFASCGPRDIKGKGIMHTFLLRVGLYEQAMAELAAASAARASVTSPKRRGGQLVVASAVAVPSETADVGDTGEASDTAAPELQAVSDDNAVVADPSRRALKAASSLSSGAPALLTVQSHWREQAATMAAGDPGCDLTDHVKYASYRYHHQQLCADVISSTGTNALMDNGLAVLVPSHALDGSMLDSLDAPPSTPGRFAHASACTVGGAAVASRAPFGSSGPVPIIPGLLTPPSSMRRLTAVSGLAPLKAAGSLLPHHVIMANGGGACALMGGASPSSSTRPSLDMSGRAVWGIAGSGAPHVATHGISIPGMAGQEGASAPAAFSQNASMRNSSYNSATTPDPTSTRTISSELSECSEEPSLHYAVNRAAATPSSGGAAGAVPPGLARVLSDVALIGDPVLSQGRPPGGPVGNQAQLRRSIGCTSEELTIAAAAAAAASNTSGDDASVPAAAQAAVETSPQLSVNLETLIAAHGFLDDMCATAGEGGAGGVVENTLAGAAGGWSVLVEALDTTGAAMHTSRGSTSNPDLTAQTLENWIQGGRGGADSRVAQSPTAVLVTPPSTSQLSPSMHVCTDADAALALEPTLAVAAEALAAAVDGALNSDTGDHILESPASRFGLGAGGDMSSRARALLTKLPSAPLPPPAALMSSSTPKRAADVREDVTMTAASGSTAATISRGADVDGRVRLLRGPSSPSQATRPYRTTSNGGMMRPQLSVQRLSYDRPSLVVNAGSMDSGGGGGGGVMSESAALGSGSGGGGSGVRECTFEKSFHKPVPGNGRTGGAAVARHNSFIRRAFTGLYGPRDGGSEDSGARPLLTGKRPATATGTIQTGISHNASQFLVREIAGAYGRGDGTFSAATAAGEQKASSPMAANGRRSGLHVSSAGAGGSIRKRPATVHGAAVNCAVLGQGREQGCEHASASMAVGLLRSQHSASATFRAVLDEGSAGAQLAAAEESPYPAWAGSGPGLIRMDSSTSSRAGFTNRANSRRSFTCTGANRQGGGGVAAGGLASMTGNGNGGNPTLMTSIGSAGGVSIISQGWSNLYDPMCPRPRLTDHYYTSGDFEDVGSAGARTPHSLMSPSIGSANPWDQSAQPSPTLLTPMHSSNVAAASGGSGGGTGGASVTDQLSAPSAAAAAAVSPSGTPMLPPGSGGPGRGGATLRGSAAGVVAFGGCGTDRSIPQQSQEPLAAEGKTDCVTDPAATFEPIFGDMSGVVSGHEVTYCAGDAVGDGAEAYMDVLDLLPMPPQHALQTRWASTPGPQLQINPQPQEHSSQLQRLPTPTPHRLLQDMKHKYMASAGRMLPGGTGSWLITTEGLESSDVALLLGPKRQGWLREPSIDDKTGRSGEGFAYPTLAPGPLGRSHSLDVRSQVQLSDSAYGSLYGSMYGCLLPNDVRVPGAKAVSKSARTWAGTRQEMSQAMAVAACSPTQRTPLANEFPFQYVHAAATVMPLASRLPAASKAPSQGDTLRSDERGLPQAHRGTTAAATAASGLPATDASLLIALATASGSSGSCPGGARGGFGEGVSSRGLGTGSHQLLAVSPVLSTGSQTQLAFYGTADSMSYTKRSNVLYSRRHSVDVVRRPPPAVAPIPPANGGVSSLGSPDSVYQRQTPNDSLQLGGAGRTVLLPRTSDGATRRRVPGGFGSPIGTLGAAAAAAAEATSLQRGSGNVSPGGRAGNGLGGLDLGRMLARASELVLASNSNGGGDTEGVKPGSPLRPLGSTTALKQVLSCEPSSPVDHLSSVAGCSVDAADAGAGAAMTAAAVTATSAALPEHVAAHPLGPDAHAAVPPNNAAFMLSTSEYHQPYHHHHHHHHPPLHSHHHPHQAMPYGLNQPVHVTRLDPVEEGCGSSAAITVDGSSASIAGSSVHNLLTAAGTATTATGSGAGSGGPPPKAPSDGPRLPSMISGEPLPSLEHRQLSLTPTNASALAAAVEGVSFSNSGAGYRGRPSASSTSTSSRASVPATTPQHAGAVGAGPWSSVGDGGHNIASSTDKGTATPDVSRGKMAKRSLSTMLRKVKNAFRSGGSTGR